MLKIERTSLYDREIAIRFRNREPFLSRNLVIGLLFAIALHILLFLFVDFKPYHLPQEAITTPLQVVVDLGSLGEEATAEVAEGLGSLSRHLVDSQSPSPKLPPFAPQAAESRPLLAQSLANATHAFSQVRGRGYRRRSAPILLYRRYKPARVTVSGPLATRTLLDDGTSAWRNRRTSRAQTALYTLLFDVQLEEKTGTLFWCYQVNTTENAALDEKGREIIRNLRFAPNPYGLTTKGRVEVCFEVEGGDPLGLLTP